MPSNSSEYAGCKTAAEFRALTRKVLALRRGNDKTPWAHPTMRALVPNAQIGRALMRKYGKIAGEPVDTGNGIAPSYPRTDEFRAAESERRSQKVEEGTE